MGSRVAIRKKKRLLPFDLDLKHEWFVTVLQGIGIGVILYGLLYCLPLTLSRMDECGDKGGLYHSGTCYKISGGIPLG